MENETETTIVFGYFVLPKKEDRGLALSVVFFFATDPLATTVHTGLLDFWEKPGFACALLPQRVQRKTLARSETSKP